FGWLLWLVATIAATCTAFYMTRLVAMTFWGKERFLEVAAGGQADEAHAHAYAEGEKPHDAVLESAGDRPRHEPGEHVGVEHLQDTAQPDPRAHLDAEGRDIHDPEREHLHDPDAHDAHSQDSHGRDTHGAHGHDDAHAGAHGHGSVIPHESPASMWVPLAVLAVLAVVGGLVGIGPAFKSLTGSEHPGGKLNIVTWLDPVIWNPATGGWGKGHAAEEHAELGGQRPEVSGLVASSSPASAVEVASATPETHGAAAPTTSGQETHGATQATRSEAGHGDNALPYGDTGFNLAHAVERATGSHAVAEWVFIIISLVVAALGILLGYLFYVKRPELPAAWAARLGPLYRASFNKYWVDELYGALVTRRTMDAARGVYQIDSKVIDGAVNGAADVTRRASRLTGNADRLVVDGAVNGLAGFIKILMSPLLRAAQTGLTPNYALVMILGLVAVVLLYFGPEMLDMFRRMFAALVF
ncbi:MAG TPA: hypothetical protein VFX96_15405, partial [Pyrinomonadaceae bacterium]|nr:hypothetical protein [Pyrinomonadaceae bacterium]